MNQAVSKGKFGHNFLKAVAGRVCPILAIDEIYICDNPWSMEPLTTPVGVTGDPAPAALISTVRDPA
jgi:hypothetical protein